VRTRIEKVFQFEAAHRLPKVPVDHKCSRMHGHSFQVTVVVEGEVDPELGWVVDFAALEEAWEPLHAMLDHRCLNEVEDLENPTSENLARYVAERVALPERVRLVSVTVGETCTSRCTVFVD
jgi:6-pyruvoyltetrahydropterin/6-carboxytetrahydropterin synthase